MSLCLIFPTAAIMGIVQPIPASPPVAASVPEEATKYYVSVQYPFVPKAALTPIDDAMTSWWYAVTCGTKVGIFLDS